MKSYYEYGLCICPIINIDEYGFGTRECDPTCSNHPDNKKGDEEE